MFKSLSDHISNTHEQIAKFVWPERALVLKTALWVLVIIGLLSFALLKVFDPFALWFVSVLK